MAGPFKGAPLSLVSITPALAGPYDYGTVVVRVAVNVDSLDAHVTALSDTVPSIVGGIPLRLRSIQVNLTKPNFILNPTNCAPMSVGSKGIGDQGTTTEFSSYFQAANCATLPFKPQMSMERRDEKMGEFNREILLRNEKVYTAMIAQLEENTARVAESSEETRAQTRALLKLIDRFDDPGSSAAAA